MKKSILILIVVLTGAVSAFGQATQPCVVRQYNQEREKTPLPGVELVVGNAGSTVSDKDGNCTLVFRSLKPGDKVALIYARKEGYEVMNIDAVEEWKISRDQTALALTMVDSKYFAALKKKLTATSTESYKTKFEQALQEIERLKKEGQLKEEEYYHKLSELENSYQNQLKNLDSYIDKFARIDLSEVDQEEQRILKMVEEGKIDEAVKAYDELGITAKLREARKKRKTLLDAIDKIEKKEGALDEFIQKCKEKQERELAFTMEQALQLDSQNQYKDAERYYLRCLELEQEDVVFLATIHDLLGVLYCKLNESAKAEEHFTKALEQYSSLCEQEADTYRSDKERVERNLQYLLYNKQ